MDAGTDVVIGDSAQSVDHADPEQPQLRLARRRVAPRLHRDLLTYRDDRYVPVFAAVADSGHSVMVIQQSLGPFTVQSPAPAVVFVDDSAVSGLGPAGFDVRSLRACVHRCQGAVIIAGDRAPTLYRLAVEMATGRRRLVLLIETRPARLNAWERTLRAVRPRLVIEVGAASTAGNDE